MKVNVSHNSALEYWRLQEAVPDRSSTIWNNVIIPDKPPIVEQLLHINLSRPVHLITSQKGARRSSHRMKNHLYSGPTFFGCFAKAKEGYRVSSPELCFLQMASSLSLCELIELGYELCGSYSLLPGSSNDTLSRGFFQRAPLTNSKRLNDFVSRMAGVKGCQKVRRALRYVLDGSASPMETKLAMLLTLPNILGGYGIDSPKLNYQLKPAKVASKAASKNYYVCDLYWPDYKLAVEYDSTQYHSGQEQIAQDSKKRSALGAMGITVMTVTRQQLYSSSEFEKVVRALAAQLGKRYRVNEESFPSAHHELRSQLFT